MTKIKQTVEDVLRQQVDNEILREQELLREQAFSRYKVRKFISTRTRLIIGISVLFIGVCFLACTCAIIKKQIPVSQTIEYQQHIKNFKTK